MFQVGKPLGKRPRGRPTYREEDNIKMYRKWEMRDWGIGSCGSEWGHVASSYEQSNECRAP